MSPLADVRRQIGELSRTLDRVDQEFAEAQACPGRAGIEAALGGPMENVAQSMAELTAKLQAQEGMLRTIVFLTSAQVEKR